VLGVPLRTMLGAQSDVYFSWVGLLLHCDGSDGSTTFTDVKGHTVTAIDVSLVLLLHCDGIDGSTTFTDVKGHTVTANGNAQIDTAQSKFGGASALFDGSGDYLSIPNSTDWDFGSSDFTIEFWMYVTGAPASSNIILAKRNSSGFSPFGFDFLASGKINFFGSQNGSSWALNITSSGAISTSQWVHVAGVRNGTSFKLYIDGTEAASTTLSGAMMVTTDPLLIAQWWSSDPRNYNGHLDDIRITKGLARYTANFTPPSAAFPDSDVTHPQIDTAQSKFGGASALFDGGGDHLSIPTSTDWDFGSGDFTIEGWAYVSVSTSVANLISRRTGVDWAPFSLIINSNKFNFRASTSGSSWAVDITGNSTINDSTWHHFAFVRSGSTFKMYVDGLAQTATGSTSSALMSSSQAIYIGANSDGTASFNGWMDDIRITKGVARYTANFTPPTEAFPDN
jgi:Concanavalin A-like lectin/glucanases superfamily